MTDDELRALARQVVDDPDGDGGQPLFASSAWTGDVVSSDAVTLLSGFLIGRAGRDFGARVPYIQARRIAEEELHRRHAAARSDPGWGCEGCC